MDVNRVVESGYRRFHHRRYATVVALQPGRDHHCRPPGDGSATATFPVVDDHLARAENRGAK